MLIPFAAAVSPPISTGRWRPTIAIVMAMLATVTGARAWEPEILGVGMDDIYLPDWSYSGYRWGEEELPRPAVTQNVLAFGAMPDDGVDDTEAILAAVAALTDQPGPVVLELPPGRLILRDVLSIERSRFILRGAGSGEGGTVLAIPIPLSQLDQKKSVDGLKDYLLREEKYDRASQELFSLYSWTGGFIWSRVRGKRSTHDTGESYGPPAVELLAQARTGLRGEKIVKVDFMPDLDAGDQIRIAWYNDASDPQSLVNHLYMATDLPIGRYHWRSDGHPLIVQYATVEATMGDLILIKEPLLHDIRPSWSTILTPVELLHEVGIENLRITFPETAYAGHHREAGYNAIYFGDISHGWIRDVAIVNADSAILTNDTAQTTIEDVEVLGRPMHYGVSIGKGSGVLARRIRVGADAIHPVSFNTYAKASVFTDIDLPGNAQLDQHRGTNHQNLFDDIRIHDAGPKLSIFDHGGPSDWRPTHGAFNTFWNIFITFGRSVSADRAVRLPSEREGPHARLVGLTANRDLQQLDYGPHAYVEGTNKPYIAIPSLYAYQRKARLGR